MAARTLTVSIPHNKTVPEVRQRMQKGLDDARAKFSTQVSGFTEQWVGDRLQFAFTAMGQNVTGFADVKPASVDLSIDLPWLLAMFAEKIRPQIETEGRKLLA